MYEPPAEQRLKYQGILLDFNENTLPPIPAVQQALASVITKNIIQIYPEECLELRESIADYCGVKANQVLLTNGSDQAIDVIFRTFTCANGDVIIPTPSYSMFYQFAELMDNNIIKPEIDSDLDYPLQDVINAISEATSLTIVCNPNNPTGRMLSIDSIAQIAIKLTKGVVYVDEAYYEFAKSTAINLLNQYPNIVISRTFSKAFGLAGLRIGYVIASAEHIAEMEKVRNPYDINIFAYYGAKAVLDNLEPYNDYINEIMNESKPLVEKFFQEKKIKYYQSDANFILFQPQQSTRDVYEVLRSFGLLVRPRNGTNIDNTIRLTIGTLEQMQAFISAYKDKILNK